MSTLSRIRHVALALLAVVGLSWADGATAGQLSLPLMFVLPVSYAAATAGAAAGLGVGVAASVVWTFALAPQSDILTLWAFALRFGVFVVVALASARAFHVIEEERALARTDGLTGLANRRALMDHLDTILKNRRAADRPLTVLLIDVDNFKGINDRDGHAEGDAVLRAVGAALRAATRDVDLVGRLGGDEFLIVLRGADADAARQVAERARGLLAARRPGLTLSMGGIVAPDARSADAVLRAADRLLYDAKRAGKDALRVRAA
jgi:diguanylate cyclase (GGDEF)-like protein